jgi:hypothetical protein
VLPAFCAIVTAVDDTVPLSAIRNVPFPVAPIVIVELFVHVEPAPVTVAVPVEPEFVPRNGATLMNEAPPDTVKLPNPE